MKKRYIRNGIVYDPNIIDDIFDSGNDENKENRKIYRQGKKKRQEYFGI